MSTGNELKFIKFSELESSAQHLVRESVRMMEMAYCPYSKYKVGAIVETVDGKQYVGCNIENIAYTPTICAERAAIANAVSSGNRQLKKVAVSAEVEEPNVISPCGVCRQVINEFCPTGSDVEIYLSTPRLDKVLVTSIKQLLPYSFPQK